MHSFITFVKIINEEGVGYVNSQRLSKRLETVASYVPEKSRVADIGSDHAFLPCYLLHKGVAVYAVAGEVAKGPYQSASNEVVKEGLEQLIHVRLADGLEAIKEEDQISVITIAGMGGPLIASILEKGKNRLAGVKRLILQPNVHAKAIREWAMANGWTLIDETIMKEDGKIYEVLVLERGDVRFSDAELLLGPYLMEKRDPIFIEKWNGELTQWKRILQSLNQSNDDHAARKKEIQSLQSLVEGVIQS